MGSALATGTVRQRRRHRDFAGGRRGVAFLRRESGRALAQPGVRLIVGDGRSHLLLTPRRYDVIISEPSNPWMSGVASLFTREFFEAARGRLKPDGLLCQWAHTYDISADDLRSIVRTFASVFPQGTMWLVGEGDLLLIGAADGAIGGRLDRARRRRAQERGPPRCSAPARHRRPVKRRSDLLSLYAGGPSELERYGGGAAIQTDDRMALEYSAPRGIYGRTANENAAAIRALAPADAPDAVRSALDVRDGRELGVARHDAAQGGGVQVLRTRRFGRR